VFVEFASVTEDAMERNVDLTIAVLSVEHVLLDKPVPQLEFAKELALLNVLVLMDPSRPAVGIDVEAQAAVELVLIATPAISDAVMELVNVFLIVTISTVAMTVVEDPAELVKMGLSAKDPMTLILDNATSTAILKSTLKLESSRPTIW